MRTKASLTGLDQKDREELMILRDEKGEQGKEIQRLRTEISMINSSRLYRLFRTTVDAVSSRKKPGPVFREYKRILRREGMVTPAVPNAIAQYPPARSTREQITEAVRARGRSLPEEAGTPLVSIVILTRDGKKDLGRLLDSMRSAAFYGNYELIIVDNGSTDGTPEWLEEQKESFRLRVIRNSENVSFSRGCNQGAEIAGGEYLLFLNNDIQVMDHWLDEMLIAALNHPDAGAVGARLLYPEVGEESLNRGRSFLVQHGGIRFSYEDVPNYGWFYKPANIQGADGLAEEMGECRPICAVTAACLLMSRRVFQEIGGFDEFYQYGYEDVDLCLKAFRKGYMNYYCPSAILFHYEFGTQGRTPSPEVSQRRRTNREYFDRKWRGWLRKQYMGDLLENRKLFTDKKLKIAFAVTETGEKAVAGDYFTALELAQAFEKKGADISFLSRTEGDWYDVGTGTDVVISMLQHWDPRRAYNTAEHLITVGWARNWFHRWTDRPYINSYTVLLASSETAKAYMERRLGRSVGLLPIATNAERFAETGKGGGLTEAKYVSDYCFTGNRFAVEREIETELYPEDLPYRFKLYGNGWEESERFARYNQGHLGYRDMIRAYRNTKVVLDDATPSTKNSGAMNSRVYDALAAGCLVLTNNTLGAAETFRGLLPSFHDRESLKAELTKYLSDDGLRERKIAELRDFVLQNHTYAKREETLRSILLAEVRQPGKRIAILICAPHWHEALKWGDYYFALSLKKAFARQGYEAEIHVQSEWYAPRNCGYTLMLRGTTEYTPGMDSFNMIWNLSHPEEVTGEELGRYDRVFVASSLMAEKWRAAGVPAVYLPQCTDPEVFTPAENGEKDTDLLFVGNTRGVYRQIIRDLLPTDHSLSIYGTGWEEFVPDLKYLQEDFVANEELADLYHSARILLNDHWADMRENGFLSNRIYDALMADTFVISDRVKAMDDAILQTVETYETPEELREKIDYYLAHPEEREARIRKGKRCVTENHTFDHRAKQLIEAMENP